MGSEMCIRDSLSRRSFLSGLFAAPAIVTASNLMPIKVLPFEPYMTIRGFDILSNEWVERRIYEKGTFDDFVSVDFLNRYEETSRFLTDVETAIALNREQAKQMAFIAPLQQSTWREDGPVRREFVPTVPLLKQDSFEMDFATPADAEFYMNKQQLNKLGYYRC